MVQDNDKEAQEIIGKLVAEAQTEQVVDIPKRVSKKPAWLKDCVKEYFLCGFFSVGLGSLGERKLHNRKL